MGSEFIGLGNSDDSSKNFTTANSQVATDAFHDEFSEIIMQPIPMSDGDRVTQAALALVQQAIFDKSFKDGTSGEIKIADPQSGKVEITTPQGSEFVNTDRKGGEDGDWLNRKIYQENVDTITDENGKQVLAIDEMDTGHALVLAGAHKFDDCKTEIKGPGGELKEQLINGVVAEPQYPLPDGKFKEAAFKHADEKGNLQKEQIVLLGQFTDDNTMKVIASTNATDKDGTVLTWPDGSPQELATVSCTVTINPENPTGTKYTINRL